MAEPLSSRDQSQLQALRAFHTVVAVLEASFAVLPVLYLTTGLQIARDRFTDMPELTESFGWGVVTWSVLTIGASLVLAILTFVAGRRLGQRRSHSFCQTVAAINCIFFPFGTILGVLTLIVLKRPSVREAFDTKPRHPNVAAWEGTKLP